MAHLTAKIHLQGELVSWSLTSLFSTNMAISETNLQGETFFRSAEAIMDGWCSLMTQGD